MLQHRSKVASSLIRQLRRGGIHLYNADDAQEEEHHPYHLVPFKQVA